MNKNYTEFTLAVPTEQAMTNAMNALKALGMRQSPNKTELRFDEDRVLRHGGTERLNYFWMSGLGPQRGNHYTNLGDLVVYLTTPQKTERQKRIEVLEVRIAALNAELVALEEAEESEY